MQIIEPLLIGNYRIVQDTELYRFTSDSVLLSRFVKARAGEQVADFCAGCGIVGLHFFAENTGIRHVTLFELQKEMAELARRTVELNGLYDLFTVENIAVQDIPPRYTEAFSLILCNPPYEKGGFENADPKKAVCRKELALPLEELVAAAARCLKFGGRFALVHRPACGGAGAQEIAARLGQRGREALSRPRDGEKGRKERARSAAHPL